MRAGDSAVVLEVLNIFAETTKENETTVSESITNATHNGTSGMKYHGKHSVLFFEVLLVNISILYEKQGGRKAGDLNPQMGPVPVN